MSGPVTGPPKCSLGPRQATPLALRAAAIPAPVARAIDDDAERPALGVLDHQDDRIDEIRVELLRGCHQKMALPRAQVGRLAFRCSTVHEVPLSSVLSDNAKPALGFRQIPKKSPLASAPSRRRMTVREESRRTGSRLSPEIVG